MLSSPCPNTAIVLPPTESAPMCAAVSIPFARPETMVTPKLASSAENF